MKGPRQYEASRTTWAVQAASEPPTPSAATAQTNGASDDDSDSGLGSSTRAMQGLRTWGGGEVEQSFLRYNYKAFEAKTPHVG